VISRSPILVGLGITCLVAGAVVLFFTIMVIRFDANDGLYAFHRSFDPNSDRGGQAQMTYSDLYHWADFVGHQRNHYALAFYYTLAAVFLLTGALFTIWAIDRGRLKRAMKECTKPKDALDGE
jgi:hypothetical protein